MRFLRAVWYSFPVQLVVLHLRRHLFMLLPWFFLVLIVTGNMFRRLGWHFLFLDPEYLGQVGFLSFYLVGVALGVFILVWNITGYILQCFRFPFLASFEKPFLRYSINNFIPPFVFLVIYFYELIRFQFYMELKSLPEVLLYQGAVLAGMLTVLVVSLLSWLNVQADRLLGTPQRKVRRISWNRSLFGQKSVLPFSYELRVDYVLIHFFRIRPVRQVRHYRPDEMMRVFRVHHKNALYVEGGALVFLLVLGFFQEQAAFRIPAAGSILLLLALLLAPVGAIFYWLRTWALIALLAIVMVLNLMVKYNVLYTYSRVYGWNYQHLVPYQLATISAASHPDTIRNHIAEGERVLDRWKEKVAPYYHPLQKPPMVIVTASGGGLKAALWAFRLNQIADSASQGRFFDHVVFISGASGGMIGEAYYRELYVRRKLGDSIDLYDPTYVNYLSRDLLNSISFSYVVHDLLAPWQSFRLGNYRYRKDRGYVFEKHLNENTGYVLRPRLQDYAYFEQQAISPMLLLASVNLDDGRRLLFSPLPVTYLTQPQWTERQDVILNVDGIDAKSFFDGQGGDSVLFTTALRMNATFPYVLPSVFLPTDPPVQTGDAGLRDNYGIDLAVRFLYTFRHWITANCSRVVVVQVRGDYEKNYEPQISRNPSLIAQLVLPISSIFANWTDYHNFHSDALLNYAESWLGVRLHIISFEYVPAKKDQVASMSLHLTKREKNDILNALYSQNNQIRLKTLLALLGYPVQASQ